MPRRWGVPIALGLLILVLAGVAVGFAVESGNVSRDADRLRAEAAQLAAKAKAHGDGVDTANAALVDTATTAEVIDTVRPVLEKVLSYDYRDLDSIARAVADNLEGSARCTYDQLFSQVRQLAPTQQLVLVSRVREIGATRIEGERASLLVFVDQTSTKSGGTTTSSGSQLGFEVSRRDGRWKITRFDTLGQPLSSGQPAQQC